MLRRRSSARSVRVLVALSLLLSLFVPILPAALGAPITVNRGGGSVSFALAGASGTLAASATAATYAGALPNVDVTYQAQSDALKETLILTSPVAPATFTFSLKTSGLSA